MIDKFSIQSKLLSGDLETQETAFQEIRSITDEWAEAAVLAMLKSESPFIIAERLSIIGSSCIRPLRAVLISEANREIRVLAALVLWQLGDLSGLSELMNEVSVTGPHGCLTVKILSSYSSDLAKITETIMDVLRRIDLSKIDYVVAYILALRNLNVALPNDVSERFNRHDAQVPWQISSLFESQPTTDSGKQA